MLNKPSFSVEPTTLTELGQQNNHLLSQLHVEVGPTKFGIWTNYNPNFFSQLPFQLCILKNFYECGTFVSPCSK